MDLQRHCVILHIPLKIEKKEQKGTLYVKREDRLGGERS